MHTNFNSPSRVTQSKSSNYAVGDLVTGMFGWRTHTIASESDKETNVVKLVAELYQDRESTALGILGMPGYNYHHVSIKTNLNGFVCFPDSATAYFGFEDILKAKEGETLVVNTAAGAVGSLVGQLAKIKGCRAVGKSSTVMMDVR